MLVSGRFTAAALFAVLSILTRPTIELLVPMLILVFAIFIHRLPLKQALRHLAIFACIYGLLMSPWWLHNYRQYGTFVRLNAGSGLMFYSGNNPANQSGGALDSDTNRKQFGTSRPSGARPCHVGAGLAYVKENPGRFVELAGLRFVRFWRLWPYAQEYTSRLYVVLSLLSFVPVLAFAIVFVARCRGRGFILVSPILLLIAYFTSIHMILGASLRYRLPLEPFLICFAALAVTQHVRRWRTSRSMAK